MKSFLSRAVFVAAFAFILGAGFASFAQTGLKAPYKWPFETRDINAELKGRTAIIELFTSESCAFCPRADAFIKDLDEKTDIIALSCHVNFFSNKSQGLALPICKERQDAYASRLTGGMKYTPQIVINGQSESIGYYFESIINKLVDASQKNPLQKISILPQKSSTGMITGYEFNLKPIRGVQSANIWIALYAPTQMREIKSGPNAGKTLTYARAVQVLSPLARWEGDARTFRFKPSMRTKPAGVVIFAETGSRIVAAGEIKF